MLKKTTATRYTLWSRV